MFTGMLKCLGLLFKKGNGGLAQLARAPALQAGGQRFESVILHVSVVGIQGRHQEEDL